MNRGKPAGHAWRQNGEQYNCIDYTWAPAFSIRGHRMRESFNKKQWKTKLYVDFPLGYIYKKKTTFQMSKTADMNWAKLRCTRIDTTYFSNTEYPMVFKSNNISFGIYHARIYETCYKHNNKYVTLSIIVTYTNYILSSIMRWTEKWFNIESYKQVVISKLRVHQRII